MKNFTLSLFCLLIGSYAFALSGFSKSLPPTGTISYNSPFCTEDSAMQAVNSIDLTPGGIYSASPVGLAINAATGEISPSGSIAGTYTVTYFIPASGPDPDFQTTASVQVITQPDAGIDGGVTVCESSTATINLFTLITGEQAGGVWTRTAGTGGVVNAVAGTYTPAMGATTTSITYTVLGAFPCINDSSVVTINVNAQASAGINGNSTICDSDTTPIDLFSIIIGEQPGGFWTRISGTGGTFNATAGTFTPEVGATASVFNYEVSGAAPCVSDSSIATVTIGSELILETQPDISTCNSYQLPFLTLGNYYTEPNGAGTLIAPGAEIFTTMTIYVYAQSGTCSDEENFQVTIVPALVPNFSPIPDICIGDPAPLLPTVSPEGITGTWAPSSIDTSTPGTMTFTFIPDVMMCAMPFSLNINIIPCAGINLNAFLDSNTNGIEDIGEPKFPLGQFNYIRNDDGIVNIAIAPNGTYTINDSNTANTYDITYSIPAPDDIYYTISTPSYSNISPDGSITTYNFPITVLQSNASLEVTLVPASAPRPGLTYVNTIYYSNAGNTVVSGGTITFTKDPLVSVQSVSEASIVNTPNGFTFDFSNLTPFETRSITVTLLVPTPPTVDAGQLLTNAVTIDNTDLTLTDTSMLMQQVVNSYDPNDKTESHGKDIVFSSFSADDYLFYTIRFENTGNANAIDVSITDVLDGALDESSVRSVAGSHYYVLNRVGNNLEFTFKDIQLPPSVPNSTVGHGYVTFKVRPNPGFAIGDIIPNTASIYFDFNPAIVTNTFNTEFVSQLATNEFNTSEFALYPNPASDKVTVTYSNNVKISTIAIYDVLGKKVIEHNSVTGNSETIDVQSLGSGMYFIEVSTSDHLKMVRKLIVR